MNSYRWTDTQHIGHWKWACGKQNTAQGDLVYRADAESTSIANMSYGVFEFLIEMGDMWQLILPWYYLLNHIKRGWYTQAIETVDAHDAGYRRCNAHTKW